MKTKISEIISSSTHQARDLTSGELEDGNISINTILDEYASDVNDLDSFVNFMFKYTSDTATLTADMPYAIGYEGDTTYSSMVTEFTDEAVRLMKNDITMTSRDNYIVTEYGIHLLYYVGDVHADVDYLDRDRVVISTDDTLDNNLYYMKSNELTGKTYFDILFDLVYPAGENSNYPSSNGYSDYENSLVETLKGENVVINTTKLRGTTHK